MKTKEELTAIKEEVETLNRKLAELTDEELEHITGGSMDPRHLYTIKCKLDGLLANGTIDSEKYDHLLTLANCMHEKSWQGYAYRFARRRNLPADAIMF